MLQSNQLRETLSRHMDVTSCSSSHIQIQIFADLVCPYVRAITQSPVYLRYGQQMKHYGKFRNGCRIVTPGGKSKDFVVLRTFATQEYPSLVGSDSLLLTESHVVVPLSDVNLQRTCFARGACNIRSQPVYARRERETVQLEMFVVNHDSACNEFCVNSFVRYGARLLDFEMRNAWGDSLSSTNAACTFGLERFTFAIVLKRRPSYTGGFRPHCEQPSYWTHWIGPS